MKWNINNENDNEEERNIWRNIERKKRNESEEMKMKDLVARDITPTPRAALA